MSHVLRGLRAAEPYARRNASIKSGCRSHKAAVAHHNSRASVDADARSPRHSAMYFSSTGCFSAVNSSYHALWRVRSARKASTSMPQHHPRFGVILLVQLQKPLPQRRGHLGVADCEMICRRGVYQLQTRTRRAVRPIQRHGVVAQQIVQPLHGVEPHSARLLGTSLAVQCLRATQRGAELLAAVDAHESRSGGFNR